MIITTNNEHVFRRSCRAAQRSDALVGGPEGRKLVAGGGASFTSATTGLSQNAHPSRRDGRAQVVALLLAPLPGRRRVVGGNPVVALLHSLHHRLPAFVPSGR